MLVGFETLAVIVALYLGQLKLVGSTFGLILP